MATRRSKPSPAVKVKSTTREEYVTIPIEDRLRRLEKRARLSDRARAWEASFLRKLTISACIYFTGVLVFMMLLIPSWYACAFVPVIGYWLGQLALRMVQDIWDSLPTR